MRDDWYFCGFAGHLSVGKRCAYHLSTLVAQGTVLVSTVGHYLPQNKDEPETIGGGKDDYYETMAFHANGLDDDLNPILLSWESFECERYKDSRDAERGHYAMCERFERSAYEIRPEAHE